MGEALLPRRSDNQDIVEVKDLTNSLRMNKCLQWLRHQREDERRKTEAEWENQILEEAASPSKPKASAEATIHEDVKIRVLDLDAAKSLRRRSTAASRAVSIRK